MRTGVRRQSKEVKLPGHERARTVLILMSVVRIVQVVSAMIRDADDTLIRYSDILAIRL
ncbi:hypothetical protein AZE42_12839 [Rhizopogon vesiculosus]|uniref:Uncharacterized protein n=1 Tax=Rhizopogon vesiculosus TaxID=180088 RepID=A0A1J8RHL7_9AGAM|nr:hypothetical protein AZE42_12839 [Rhizopogon vesiculosus]